MFFLMVVLLQDLCFRGGCSHGRANIYYMESVLSLVEGKQFLSWLCPTWEDFLAGSCCESATAVMGAGITRFKIDLKGTVSITFHGKDGNARFEQNPSKLCLIN